MQVQPKAFFNTKMWVPRADAMGVQNELLKCAEFGYELALEKSKLKHKFSRKIAYVAFFIDSAGYIEFIEVPRDEIDECYDEYCTYREEEINYEMVF